MSKIHFKPWVGDNYRDNAGIFEKRILILGESHYQWDKNIPPPLPKNLTIECIEYQIEGKETKEFWTKVTNLFLGEINGRSLEEKKKFWNSVAFANFVQESVGFGSRKRPSKEMWEGGRKAFPEILSETCPHLIAVLGCKLWDNLPIPREEQGEGQGPDIINVKGRAKHSKTTYFYSHPKGKALAFRLWHPSAWGFSYAHWENGLKEAISKAPSD